jgi:hypothetical protein
MGNLYRPSLIEEIALFPSDVTVEKIHVVRVNDGPKSGKKALKKPKLIILTKDQVTARRVPVLQSGENETYI